MLGQEVRVVAKSSMVRRFLRPLYPRDPGEHHRTATPLELLFDLVTVIAIASAAAGLHHAIDAGHAREGIITFLMAFFAVWWAWMNFTWYASAYDNDDIAYRLLTMLLMAGSLVIAAGIPAVFNAAPDFTMVIFGYAIMRVGMIVLWLRAAFHDKERRRTALAYAAGLCVTQLYWLAFLAVQPLSAGLGYGLFMIGAMLELLVPAVAEPLSGNTRWHRHHIIERYGLLNLIVLGETLLAGSTALREITGAFNGSLALTAMFALVIVFSLWWAYFDDEKHLQQPGLQNALLWGYGHFLIFAAGAAVGAGFGVVVDVATHHAEVTETAAQYAVAVPVAIYLASLWFVRDRRSCPAPAGYALMVGALLTLLVPTVGLGLGGIAACTALSIMLRNLLLPAAVNTPPAIH